MARGVEMTFDLMVTAIVVGVVLAILMLIFVDNARSFHESIEKNRCSGLDCGFDLQESRSGLIIAHPTTVYTGERAVFRVVDTEYRFATVRVEVDAPSKESGSRLTGGVIDPGPSVHTPVFEGTDEVGSYAYRLIGVKPNGEEVVIERGELHVLERQGVVRASVRIDVPQRIPSPAQLTVSIPTDAYASGRLIFTSADRTVTIDVEPAGAGVLAGRSYEGLMPGIYVLDPDASRLDDVPLDSSITVIVRVSDPTPCTSSASCDEEMPYCTDGFCSPICAASGERAADTAGCCADHTIREGVCTLPGRPLRIVLVPIGTAPERMGVLAAELESALRASSPLDACPSSRLSIEIAQGCASCALAERAVSRSEYDSCLDDLLSCALSVRPDVDLIGGIVGAASMRISSEEHAFFARSERSGQRFVIADPDANAGGEFLRQIGFVYGLDQLACGAQGPACTGPNAADCDAGCTPSDPSSCFTDSRFSSEFVMASCERLRFGPAGYDVLAGMDAFVRATEVCR